MSRCSRRRDHPCVSWWCRRCPRSRAATTGWPRSSTTRRFAPRTRCWRRPPARCAGSARSGRDLTCAAAGRRAGPAVHRGLRPDRQLRGARALPARRAARPVRRRAAGAVAGRGVRLPGRCAAAGRLARVLGAGRVRPGHAGPQHAVATPVRRVLPHLLAACDPGRTDRGRLHRDGPPPEPVPGGRPGCSGPWPGRAGSTRLPRQPPQDRLGLSQDLCVTGLPVAFGEDVGQVVENDRAGCPSGAATTACPATATASSRSPTRPVAR